MVEVTDLLLPSSVAAIAVFVVSSVVHLVLAYHINDFGKLPDEERGVAAIRGASVPPGNYRFPYTASMKEMGTPEMMAKFQTGPVGYLTIMPPGGCAIGKSLGQWFALSLAISLGAGWISAQCLAPGAAGDAVFRVAAIASFLAYGCAPVTDSIWKAIPWSVCAKFIFDGVLYAAATGAVFAAMWPPAA